MTSMEKHPIFRQCAYDVAERILGCLDRDPTSPTFGCFDRNFWRYMVIDYPSAWFQSGVEYLAWLYNTPGAAFHQNPVVKQWIEGGIGFTIKWLNKDGSAIEVYPGERSFCATSFVASHLAFVAKTIGVKPAGLKRMGEFLVGRVGDKVSNQLAASALAQMRLGSLFNDTAFTADGLKKLNTLYDVQSADGYFPEYGGFDVGYLTITLSLLARMEAEFPGSVDIGRIQRALKLLERAVDETGNYDYASMSRRTQFLYPYGLAFFRSPVLERLENGLRRNEAMRPSWLDDRYVAELAIDHFYASAFISNPPAE